MKELDDSLKQKIFPDTSNDIANADAVLIEKLSDAMTPGFEAEFDPEEAERAGAFHEDALSEADALDSCIDAEN